MKKCKFFVLFLALFCLCTMTGVTTVKAENRSDASEAGTQSMVQEITLYGLSSAYEDHFSIPSDVCTEYRIVADHATDVSYAVTRGNNITVDADGTVRIKYKLTYWYENMGTSWPIEGKEPTSIEKSFDPGDATVTVNADGVKTDVTVHVEDYAKKYADDQIQNYINENIAGKNLSDLELMKVITAYPASFNYSASYSSYQSMIIYGGGDCWASTSLIMKTCELLGIDAWSRNGNKDFGAGSGHINALVHYNGNYYELEAGYTGKAPRYYSVEKRQSLFCFHEKSDGTLSIYQYDGKLTASDTLEVPATYQGMTVTEVEKSFSQGSNRECGAIHLPDTITKIGEFAFSGFEQATEINIPASVKEIGTGAFAQCLSLEKFTCEGQNNQYASQDGILYNRDKTIALSGPAVNNPQLPDSLQEIAEGAFSYNTNLVKMILPETVKKIDDNAFFADYNVKNVTIKAVDPEIGKNVFYNCWNLTLRGTVGSVVETYANDNEIAFRDIQLPLRNGLYQEGDVWYYYIDDELAKGVTTLVEDNGSWWYVENGKVNFHKVGLFEYNDTLWYIWDGQVDFSATMVYYYNGEEWYVQNGCVDKTYNGLVDYMYERVVVRNGKLDFSFNGIVSNEDGDWYCTNGRVRSDMTGFVQSDTDSDSWYYIQNGCVQKGQENIYLNGSAWWYVGTDGKTDFNKNTLLHNENGWWVVRNGVVDFDVNGIVSDASGDWYFKNGQVDLGATGVLESHTDGFDGWYYVQNGCVQKGQEMIQQNSAGWWYIGTDGKVDFDKNTVAQNAYGWWAIRNGAVDFGLNGIASNASGDWYCRGGQVDFWANGVLESWTDNFSGWYYIQNGCLQKGQETVQQNSSGWWYIGTDGKVDFNKNTVAQNAYGWWAIRNGAVDFNLNGIASNASGDWYCRNGQVDFGANGVLESWTDNFGGWYYIQNGCVQKGQETVQQNSTGWWYIGTDGKVDFTFTGIASNQNGSWYLENGRVNFDYNGIYQDTNGRVYDIKYGQAV